MTHGQQAPVNAVDETEDRERKAAAAAIRFRQLSLEIASEHRFGGPAFVSTEIDMMEEATRLVNELQGNKL